MNIFLSCLTAPFHKRFWTIFLFMVVATLLTAVFTLTVMGAFDASGVSRRTQSVILWSAVGLLIFIWLVIWAYMQRILRHACLRGTPDALVAGDTVLPAFWGKEALSKMGFVIIQTFGFTVSNVFFFTVVFILSIFMALACFLSFLMIDGMTFEQIERLPLTMLLVQAVQNGWVQSETFVLGLPFALGVFLLLLNGIIANFHFVQTWDMWESWRVTRNLNTAFRHFLLVAVICAVCIGLSVFPLTDLAQIILIIPGLGLFTKLALGTSVQLLLIVYYLIFSMALIGRLFYYLRLQVAQADNVVATPVVPEPVVETAVSAPATQTVVKVKKSVKKSAKKPAKKK